MEITTHTFLHWFFDWPLNEHFISSTSGYVISVFVCSPFLFLPVVFFFFLTLFLFLFLHPLSSNVHCAIDSSHFLFLSVSIHFSSSALFPDPLCSLSTSWKKNYLKKKERCFRFDFCFVLFHVLEPTAPISLIFSRNDF